MSRKMLMDAAHPEEVRVVICNDNSVEEFEYQTQSRKSIKGYIYLAKVTRVEPSLQAAFVDYGSNKHGFLPFSEIHPDYYQIPVADRQRLIEELKNSAAEPSHKKPRPNKKASAKRNEDENKDLSDADNAFESVTAERENNEVFVNHEEFDEESKVERPQFYKRYGIQEVIKKDQVILIQVEKEERGNKGASLTTYISLAGRYCVLMPNSTKGAGVSRKIADDQDRQRLKKISLELTQELEGHGAVIIRTAGAYKTKTEIKRDLQYLQKLWDNIREHTVKSTAPTFIHEEGDIIKKSLRDLYDSEIEEILIEGKDAYDAASAYMKMILPRHVNKVKHYTGSLPLFSKAGIEKQIAELYTSKVPLRSGGYLVINQTEALVAIDVNSGRATSERNIEDTAFKTNLEAAYEIARQMRLRDLSGLIVVDFIDMDEVRNKKAIERAMKDNLSADKAKVQVGKISSFGLLEMSRQRLRQTLVESNTEVCEHCNGKGRVRLVESTATVVIRALENEIATGNMNEIEVSGAASLMFYLSNNKRNELARLEKSFNGKILLSEDETAGGDGFFLESKKGPKNKIVDSKALSSIDESLFPEAIEEDVEKEQQPKSSGRIKFKKKPDLSQSYTHTPHTPHAPHTPHKHKGPQHVRDVVKENAAVAVASHVPKDDEVGDSANNADLKYEDGYKKPHNRFQKHKKDFIPREGREGVKNPNPHHENKPKQIHHESRNPSEYREPKKDFRNKPAPQPFHSNDRNEDNYDQEMAMKRKQNQSLLKEIWKKIVD